MYSSYLSYDYNHGRTSTFLLSCILLFYGNIFRVVIFKASALWADAFYKLKCPSVRVSVRLFTFRYRLNVFLPPLPEVGCPKFSEIRNPWGSGLKSLRKKSFLLLLILPYKTCWKPRFPMDERPLVEGYIANFGISLDVFEFLRFGWFFPFFKKKWFLGIQYPTVVLVLLSASVKRCFVSRMRDFLLFFIDSFNFLLFNIWNFNQFINCLCWNFIFLRNSLCWKFFQLRNYFVETSLASTFSSFAFCIYVWASRCWWAFLNISFVNLSSSTILDSSAVFFFCDVINSSKAFFSFLSRLSLSFFSN